MFDKLPCGSDAGGLELHPVKHSVVLSKQKSSTSLGISEISQNSSLCLFPWVLGLTVMVPEEKIHAFL